MVPLTFYKKLLTVIHMIRFMRYFLLLSLICASCISTPSSIEEMQPEVTGVPAEIDNGIVTPEQQETTEQETQTQTPQLSVHEMYYDPVAEADIRQALENLSRAIRTSNINNWREVLAEDYYQQVISAENLANLSNSDGLKSRNIVLRTERDYFTHVVVPSRRDWARSNIEDEIEFLSADHVRVYGQTVAGRRGQVYELTRIDNQWKVTN